MSLLGSLLAPLRRALFDTNDEPQPIDTLTAGQHVWCLAARDGTIYAGLSDGRIAVWRCSSEGTVLVGELRGHHGTVYALHASGPNFLVSSGADAVVRLWACTAHQASMLPTPTATSEACGHGPILALAGMGPCETIYSGGADGNVRR